MKILSWKEAKKEKSYYYSGDSNTPNEIADTFQELANVSKEDCRDIVSLEYEGYRCEVDIFWQDIDMEKPEYLSMEMFVVHKDNVINNSGTLKISDIYKKDYLERTMYEFILESNRD